MKIRLSLRSSFQVPGPMGAASVPAPPEGVRVQRDERGRLPHGRGLQAEGGGARAVRVRGQARQEGARLGASRRAHHVPGERAVILPLERYTDCRFKAVKILLSNAWDHEC